MCITAPLFAFFRLYRTKQHLINIQNTVGDKTVQLVCNLWYFEHTVICHWDGTEKSSHRHACDISGHKKPDFVRLLFLL